MAEYIEYEMNVSEGQQQKLKEAAQSHSPVSIRFRHEDLIGKDVLSLTKTQVKRLKKAYEEGKGITIKMSKKQLDHNMRVEGGFLPMIAGLGASLLPMLAKTVLPALGVGALSGLASSGVHKIMGSGTGPSTGNGLYLKKGNGLYLKKGGCICQIETDGKGLYLGPAHGSGLESVGDGLYLKKGGEIYNGGGLLLGPNSPFNGIPFLGALL